MDKYILDADGHPVLCRSVAEWGRWYETANKARRVALDEIAPNVRVSTIFLGLDHNSGRGEPVLWETLVFGGPLDEYMVRYTSRADAVAGHARVVDFIKDALVANVSACE